MWAAARLARARNPQTQHPSDAGRQEQVEQMRESSLRAAAHQTRKAVAQRDEAARRAQAAALADSMARREELEIAQARASGVRQAEQYHESGLRSRQVRAAQPELEVPGHISDPLPAPGRSLKASTSNFLVRPPRISMRLAFASSGNILSEAH